MRNCLFYVYGRASHPHRSSVEICISPRLLGAFSPRLAPSRAAHVPHDVIDPLYDSDYSDPSSIPCKRPPAARSSAAAGSGSQVQPVQGLSG